MSQPLPPPIIYQPRPRTTGGNAVWLYVFIAACFAASVGVLLYAIEENSPKAMLRDVVGKMKANADEAKRTQGNLTAEAKRVILPSLRAFGIMSLGDDTGVTQDGGHLLIGGTGKTTRGELREVLVQCDRVAFGSDVRWKILAIVIDGKVVQGDIE